MSGWLSDPAEIYRRSFATIQAEAALDGVPTAVRPMAVRMIHACGMTDLAADLRSRGDPVGAIRAALTAARPVFVDSKMVSAGLGRASLPSDPEIVCGIDDFPLADEATAASTTRSAAMVMRWRPLLSGAVVIIGNAPTALFQLLDDLASGVARPAAIIATPVGFVGAAESKQALVDMDLDIPFVTVLGRRGGSAMAAAAFNACFLGAE